MASESTSVEGRSSKRARPRAVMEHDQRLDRIRADLMRLNLAPHVLDLELYGYTILPEVKPPAFCDQLRETILKLGEEDRLAGRRIPLAGADGQSYLVTWLLARDPIFEAAVMAEKPLALITYLMGESCQISSNHGHVRVCGDPPQGLHTDAPLVAAPIPSAPVASNMMWVLDDFSEEAGATLVVPGSHRQLVHPGPSAAKAAVSITARKGSVIVFNGNLWHGAGARTLPGERVGMTVYFNRMYIRPQEDLNAVISDEAIARNPPRFAHLVGRNNPYPAREYAFFNPKGYPYFEPTQDRFG